MPILSPLNQEGTVDFQSPSPTPPTGPVTVIASFQWMYDSSPHHLQTLVRQEGASQGKFTALAISADWLPGASRGAKLISRPLSHSNPLI